MSIPYGVMGQSAVFDFDISWSYSLVESICLLVIQIAIYVSVIIYHLYLKRVAFVKAMSNL